MKAVRIAAAFAVVVAAPASAQERLERGALVLENVPETPPALAERLRQYQNTRSGGLVGFSADGEGVLVATRFGETRQIHHVSEPMGARRQITFYDEPLGGVSPSPTDADFFAFTRDEGGDENYQVFIFNRATGAATRISDGQGRKGGAVWSPEGDKLAWYTTLEGTTRGIVVADEDAPQNRRIVFEKAAWMAPIEFSPDGSTLLLRDYVSINENSLWLLDIESGEAARVNPSDEKISYGAAAFGPDGGTLFFSSDEDGEFRSLYLYDIKTGEKTNITPDIDWDVAALDISPTGDVYAFTTNEAGRSRLYIRRLKDDRDLPAPDLPPGAVGGLEFAPDGSALGFTLNAADAPSDVYTWRLGRRGKLARWTQSEVGGLDPDAFFRPEMFDYPTFDEVDGAPRRIPAFIYRPEGAGPHPVVVSIHGGPEGQARPTFSSTYQFWAQELGVAVVVPNVRGSSGFGKTYVALDNGRKREDSVKDIGALLDWIDAAPDLDGERVMVYGGSYGGYMVLASMVRFNDRLAGGVDIVGISNFVTFLENTAEYRKDVRRPEYGDERDPEMRAFLDSISPLTRADEIRAPLFIIQGLNDPRVPASEAEQILAAMRENDIEAWYMAAKDEGHGFRKKSNRDAMTEAVALFIEKVLGDE
ncbi:MAG: prolyl oligopeptidase family serine peptidase [Pseudomonadota bacterium]